MARPWWYRFALALLISLALPAMAQDDPPGRVGRIAELQGRVWYYDLESGDWVAAELNRALTTGDRVATDGDGRAEIRIGSASLRLGAGSEIDILGIDDQQVRLQLHSGRLALRLRSQEVAREFELVTDEGSFRPERAGRYRLDRNDATSSVTVASGELRFQSPDTAITVGAGQRAEISRVAGATRYTLLQPQRDAFYDEVAAADAAAERSVSTTRYVSPEMTGAEQLDAYGRWTEDAEHGALWVPRAVVPGWAPYRFGRWAWVRPWGWTWIDDAPWGFAPFHFGRWVFWRNSWCWAPGRWVARPVFAPALVVWIGAPVIGIGIGPGVGWFPLGPREVFVPPYRVTPHYVRNVNVTQVTNITNVTQIVNSPNTVVQQTHYIYRGAGNAVTVVPASVVTQRQPVAPARVRLTDPDIAHPDQRRVALASPLSAAAPLRAPVVPRPPSAKPPAPRTVAAPATTLSPPNASARPAHAPAATTVLQSAKPPSTTAAAAPTTVPPPTVAVQPPAKAPSTTQVAPAATVPPPPAAVSPPAKPPSTMPVPPPQSVRAVAPPAQQSLAPMLGPPVLPVPAPMPRPHPAPPKTVPANSAAGVPVPAAPAPQPIPYPAAQMPDPPGSRAEAPTKPEAPAKPERSQAKGDGRAPGNAKNLLR